MSSSKSSMMELDPKRDKEFDEFVKYCMTSGVINQNLYV